MRLHGLSHAVQRSIFVRAVMVEQLVAKRRRETFDKKMKALDSSGAKGMNHVHPNRTPV